MLLWIVMAVFTAAASLSVLVPLYRERRGRAANAPELAIYRDQFAEVDRDLGRGLIADSEASAARTEIARRLLRADEAGVSGGAAAGGVAPAGGATQPGEHPRRVAALVAIIGLPLVALGFYLLVGSPQLPDQPLAARLSSPLDRQDIGALVSRVEQHLAASPEDGRGWAVLGPIYVKLGRYDDAVRAFSNAIRLLGSDADREASLGEAIVRANQGVVTADARAAFERANQLDATAIRPRFYLAIGLGQEGKKDEAIAAWQALLNGAPPDAPWVQVAASALAKLQGGAADVAGPGPTASDVEAAQKLTPDERLAMINGMVTQLAAKLDGDPSDAEGWAKLIRSYMVLGRGDDAKAALAKARQALAGDTTKLAAIDAAARELGLAP